MRRVLIATATLAALLAPATGAMAKPSKADKREARQECRALRGHDAESREAFKAQWGSFGKCVRAKTREAEAERKADRRNAARECREERKADRKAFEEKYGSNHNKKNAFGKCVSQKAKAKQKEQDQQDAAEAKKQTNAAHDCAAERSADRKAFEDTYGTNHNKRNAFGKCVSQKVREDEGGSGS